MKETRSEAVGRATAAGIRVISTARLLKANRSITPQELPRIMAEAGIDPVWCGSGDDKPRAEWDADRAEPAVAAWADRIAKELAAVPAPIVAEPAAPAAASASEIAAAVLELLGPKLEEMVRCAVRDEVAVLVSAADAYETAQSNILALLTARTTESTQRSLPLQVEAPPKTLILAGLHTHDFADMERYAGSRGKLIMFSREDLNHSTGALQSKLPKCDALITTDVVSNLGLSAMAKELGVLHVAVSGKTRLREAIDQQLGHAQ